MPTYRLTKHVTIYKASKPTSDFNYAGFIQNVIATAWAQITPITGTERTAAEQVTSESTHLIIIRWPNASIESGMIVSCNEQTYEIQDAIDVNGSGQYVSLRCTQHKPTVGVRTTR